MSRKLAIVGVGAWGINHVKVATKLRALGIIDDIVAMDVLEERARYVSRLYGVSYTTDLDTILRDDGIQAAIVAVPTSYHYEVASKLLDSGKHVLVEKPITGDSSRARDLIDIAKRNNRILGVGFLLRYSPAVHYVRNKILGGTRRQQIFSLQAERLNPKDGRKYDIGVVMDLMIHDIDLSMFLFDAKPLRVYAQGKEVGGLDMSVMAMVEYKVGNNEFCSVFEASRMAPQKVRRTKIFLEDTIVLMDLARHTLEILHEESTLKPNIGPADPLFEEDKNFIMAVFEGEKLLVDAQDCIGALVICEGILESMRSGNIVGVRV